MKKLLTYLFIALILIGFFLLYQANLYLTKDNVLVEQKTSFYIYPNQSYDHVLQQLHTQKIVENILTFNYIAKLKKYPSSIKPGHYLIEPGMSNNALINLLRSGNQRPINLQIQNLENLQKFSGYLGKQLMADSADFWNYFSNNDSLAPYGFNTQTIPCMLLANTYEFYWTISPSEFLKKMQKEYQNYWTGERIAKAQKQGLSPNEVCILASISQKETSKKDEASKVAGVYLNRYRLGMPLQADPTLIFAIQDFSIKRVLAVHKEIESPYNTYKYKGLPPGPIDLPEAYVQSAILDYDKHDYLYFCAKDDFSGYHNFAKNYAQHLVYARQYQKALNKKHIFQ